MAGFILCHPNSSGMNCTFTGYGLSAFDTEKSDRPYRGFDIYIQKLDRTGTAESWLFLAKLENKTAFTLKLIISDMYIGGSQFLIAQEGGIEEFATKYGLQRVHGVIDVGTFKPGEHLEYMITSNTQSEINKLEVFVPDDVIRLTLLNALFRSMQADPLGYQSELTDLDGFASVLNVKKDKLLFNIQLLVGDGKITAATNTRDPISKGAFFITGKGIDALLETGLDGDVRDTKLQSLSKLRRKLAEYFSLDELKILCHDLGFDYEDFEHGNKQILSLELVKQAQKSHRIEKLMAIAKQTFPNVNWNEN
jgi:hypothetical protein